MKLGEDHGQDSRRLRSWCIDRVLLVACAPETKTAAPDARLNQRRRN
jgi:hypothetical protein